MLLQLGNDDDKNNRKGNGSRMKKTKEDEMFDALWKKAQKESLKLKIVMAGKTGVGKTSLVNSIIGKNLGKVAEDAGPCTRENKEETFWLNDMGELIITDVPGFGEAGTHLVGGMDYEENVRHIAKDAHILLMVLSCTDKALEKEEEFLKKWKSDPQLSRIPVLIAVNKIDMAKPSKIWDPDNLNLEHPTTEKERQIKSYIDYVSGLDAFNEYAYAGRIFPVCAGESWGDQTYGIENLQKAISDSVPEVLRLILERERGNRMERAETVIRNYALSAAGIAVEPVPIVDSVLLAPVQIAMVVHLGKIYGKTITKSLAKGLVNTIGLSFVGNELFLLLVGFFPGIKQTLGPAIAYSLTRVSGLIVNELFANNNLNPTKDQLKTLTQKYKKELKKSKEAYEKKIG